MPITPSQSGHLLNACDHFDQAAKQHKAKHRAVFVVDHRNTVDTEEAEASAEAEAHVAVSPSAASSLD